MTLVSAIRRGQCESCGECQDGYFRSEDEHAVDRCRCGGLVSRFYNARFGKAPAGRMEMKGRERRLKEKGLIDIGGESPASLAREHRKMEQYREEREEREIDATVDEVLNEYDDSFFFREGESDTGESVPDGPPRDDADTFVGEVAG